MKLNVDRLTESPTPHTFSAPSAWWREGGHPGADVADLLREPVEFRIEAHRMGADVYLEGEATGKLALLCSRCLVSYEQPIRERFRLVLEPAGHRVPADPEAARVLARDGMALSDELESGWFRGAELDLRGFLQEIVALLLPVQPLCRENCRGLCPQCGTDRNVSSCSCGDARPGSPFEALRGLRDELVGRGSR